MNSKKQTPVTGIVTGAMIAALYAAATYASAAFSLAYGPIQFRLSEVFTILSVFTPYAIPGLTIGCILGNIASPYGLFDIVLGSFATLCAAVGSRLVRNVKIKDYPILAPLMPVIANSVIVGVELALFSADGSISLANLTFSGFAIAALQVGIGELVVCYVPGLILYRVLKKTKLAEKYF